MAPSGQSETARTAPALLAGVLLYVVCWLVPVVQGQELFGAMGLPQSIDVRPDGGTVGTYGPNWLPGWSTCHFEWRLLTEVPSPPSGGGDDWKRIVLGSTCLTNVAMLTVMLVLACGARPRRLGALLLACALLNTSWIWLGGGVELIKGLRAGYYLWVGSFVVTGIALLVPAARPPSRA